jgi:isopentenyldiphosphate isomerase
MNAQPTFAQDPDELFDVVNEDGSATGIVKRRADVHRDGDWHRAIHVWIYGVHDGMPFMLFNLRGQHKDTWPGVLDVTVGGHLTAGETVEQAYREIEEEIGIIADPAQLRFLETRKARGVVERELQDVFLYRDDRSLGEYRPNPAELEGLVRLSVTNALAIFSEQAETAMATVLHAADQSIRPLTITPGILLPVRYYAYYLSIAQAIERVIESEPSLM